jgi:DNA (cytosine-5)-methyltransferase 1
MPSMVVKTLTPRERKDLWRTPPAFFAYAARRYGPFKLDAAASAEDRHCAAWFGPGSPLGEDALTESWCVADEGLTRVWCNPPYSLNAHFVAKAREEARTGRVQTTLLLPATVDVDWWHEYIWEEAAPRPGVLVELVRGRVRFLRPDGTPAGSPNFGSALVTFLARETLTSQTRGGVRGIRAQGQGRR